MLANENIDAVISFPHPDMQFEVAKDCMLANINVYSERPVCFNLEQARELLKVQVNTKSYLTMRLNRRFTPSYVMARKIIKKEEFGKVTMYLAKYHTSEYESERAFIHYHIIHHLDLARFLLGEITKLDVETVRLSNTRVGFNISFVTAGGAIGVIQSSSIQHESYPMERVEITGDRRNVIVDNIRRLEYNKPGTMIDEFCEPILEESNNTLLWNLNFARLSGYTFYGLENGLFNFIDSTLKGIAPEFNMEDAIHTLELVEKFKKSLK
jgi:predicted dehydrogenase